MSAATKISHALQEIAHRLDGLLESIAGVRVAFCLVVSTERVQYISNGPRDEITDMLKTLIARWEHGVPDPAAHEVSENRARDPSGETAPRPRWQAIVTYRSDAGPIDVTHDIEELGELHDLVERGPDWNAIDTIVVKLQRSTGDTTIEQAAKR